MAMFYKIAGAVSDGDYVVQQMGADYSQCELSSIRFFDVGGNQVTPTGGNVVFSGSPDGVNYRDINGGSFLASSAYSPSRVPPYADGLMISAKISLSGVAGAVSFEALVWRD